MMDDDEKSIAGFKLAETMREEESLVLKDDFDSPIIPKLWIVSILAFAGYCLYLTSIDALLLIWGKTTVGVFYQCGRQTIMGCDRGDYVFEDQGRKYNATVNYHCSMRGDCIRLRDKVSVDYISWNPNINKATYDLYTVP